MLVGQIFLTPELCFLRLPKESPRNREKALDKQPLERPLPIHLRILEVAQATRKSDTR